MNEIDWDKAEVLIIHDCAWGKFTGNKVKLKSNLPSKCVENLCGFYATYYGTCIKTGEKCTDCNVKSKPLSKTKPSSIVIGESIVYKNAKNQTVERIVLSESMSKVVVLEIIMGQEKTFPITRGVYIQRRAEVRKAERQESSKRYPKSKEVLR